MLRVRRYSGSDHDPRYTVAEAHNCATSLTDPDGQHNCMLHIASWRARGHAGHEGMRCGMCSAMGVIRHRASGASGAPCPFQCYEPRAQYQPGPTFSGGGGSGGGGAGGDPSRTHMPGPFAARNHRDLWDWSWTKYCDPRHPQWSPRAVPRDPHVKTGPGGVPLAPPACWQ